MIEELVESYFNEWIASDLTKYVAGLKSTISERELKRFIIEHENLPLFKRNLVAHLSVPEFCLDKKMAKFATVEMAKFFAICAVKIHDNKRKIKVV
jgi:hypothetical protein